MKEDFKPNHATTAYAECAMHMRQINPGAPHAAAYVDSSHSFYCEKNGDIISIKAQHGGSDTDPHTPHGFPLVEYIQGEIKILCNLNSPIISNIYVWGWDRGTKNQIQDKAIIEGTVKWRIEKTNRFLPKGIRLFRTADGEPRIEWRSGNTKPYNPGAILFGSPTRIKLPDA